MWKKYFKKLCIFLLQLHGVVEGLGFYIFVLIGNEKSKINFDLKKVVMNGIPLYQVWTLVYDCYQNYFFFMWK